MQPWFKPVCKLFFTLLFQAPVGDDVIDFSAESFLMTYELSNAGPEPATFLPWKTPLDDIWEDVIQVFDSKGREIEYTGKVARRGCVTDDDYMTIGAGATLKVSSFLYVFFSFHVMFFLFQGCRGFDSRLSTSYGWPRKYQLETYELHRCPSVQDGQQSDFGYAENCSRD